MASLHGKILFSARSNCIQRKLASIWEAPFQSSWLWWSQAKASKRAAMEMHCQNSQRACIMDHDAILTLLLHHVLYCHYVISNFKLPRKATNDLGAGLEVHQLQASQDFSLHLPCCFLSLLLITNFTTDYISKGHTINNYIIECLQVGKIPLKLVRRSAVRS